MSAIERDPEAIRPFDAVMLSAGDGHWIYCEEVGRKEGVPALFLHGGPGSGSQHVHRKLFHPDNNHTILFDQRGAGRSHPYLSCHANTTQHLIADIELIRNFYKIEKWIVVGGSWGSTLAIAYAETFPERVSAIVLRAIFLGTRQEVKWAFIDGPQKFRPELYEQFVRALPDGERGDPLASYLKRLRDPDKSIHGPAAHVWSAYERALSVLDPGPVTLPTLSEQPSRIAPTPLIEAHYIAHDFFLGEDQLIANAGLLRDIPGVMVQSRYDLLCPPVSAYGLQKRWSGSRLTLLEAAGHAQTETGVEDALRAEIAAATERYR